MTVTVTFSSGGNWKMSRYRLADSRVRTSYSLLKPAPSSYCALTSSGLEDVYARGVHGVRVELIPRHAPGLQFEVLRVHAREQVVGLFERPDVRLAETDDDGFALLLLRGGGRDQCAVE
jgi:hypothetical protein